MNQLNDLYKITEYNSENESEIDNRRTLLQRKYTATHNKPKKRISQTE